MDFSLTEDQESLRTLAADIFGDKATPERVEADRGHGRALRP